MPESMPAGGYLSDYLIYWYVVATLLVFARVAWCSERRRLATLLGVAFTFAAVVLAAESYDRYIADAPNDGLPTLASRAWYKRHSHSERNERGFRGPDWPNAAPPGRPRTLLLGDEVVASYGLSDHRDGVVAQLAGLWNGADVVSAGAPGWHTGNQLAWLAQNAASIGAERVLLLYSADDAVDLLAPDQRLDIRELGTTRSSAINPARSFTAETLWYRSLMRDSPWWRDRVQLRDESARRTQEDRIRSLAAVCSRHGIALDVAILPWPGDGESERAHASLASDMWTRAGAGRVVNFGPTLDVTERVSRWAPWPNEDAHAALAERLNAEFR